MALVLDPQSNSASEVIDGIRRIVSKWANTVSPLISDANIGDSTIQVKSTKRFRAYDTFMLSDGSLYETGLIIESIIDRNTLKLISPISSKNWTVAENSVAMKSFKDMILQGVYFGEPSVIPSYPAVTVSCPGKTSEWLTIESTKERYEVTINIYALDSTQEDGHRFVLDLGAAIETGLKRNVLPLIGHFTTIPITADIYQGDIFIKVPDTSVFAGGNATIIIEDDYSSDTVWIKNIIDSTTLELWQCASDTYSRDDSIIIRPERYFYNSWAPSVDYGKIYKEDLLQAVSIKWFGEEEQLQRMRKVDPKVL